MTANEFLICIEAHELISKEKLIEVLFGSWHTVAFDRTKKLPDFNKVVKNINKTGKTSNSDKEVSQINRKELVTSANKLGLKVPEGVL